MTTRDDDRERFYERYGKDFPRWAVDAAVEFAREHRNDDYIPILLKYGAFFLTRIEWGFTGTQSIIAESEAEASR